MKIKTRTVTFRAVKGAATGYPVPYIAWTKTASGFIPGALRWEEASDRLAERPLVATPLRGTSKEGRLSPWLTVPSESLAKCRRIIAPVGYEPAYEAHAGIFTGDLNGA